MSDHPSTSWFLSPLAPIIESMMEGVPGLIEIEPIEDATRYVNAVQRCCEYLITIAENDAKRNAGK